jgi:SAM-dependent methyltransferase
MPEIYDRALGPALFRPYALYLSEIVARGAPDRVLELAAGSGIATVELLRVLPEASITATDLNPAMVEWAKAKAPGAKWQVADAQALGYDDESFDAVVCQFGAMFFPDRPGAFREMARVLRRGGVAHLAIWDVMSGSPFTQVMFESLETVLGDDPPDFFVRVPHGYTDPEVIAADIQAGGLRVDALDHTVLTGWSPDARTLVEGYCLGTPLQFALAGKGDIDELVKRLAEEMARRLGEGPLHGELAAWVVRAIRD